MEKKKTLGAALLLVICFFVLAVALFVCLMCINMSDEASSSII